jgi:glycine cleavage system H protein
MSEVPDGLLYSRDHEWVRIEGDVATVGITDYAQEQLGDLTYVELPEMGEEFEQHTEAAIVESVKAASDVYIPVAGTVTEVNSELLSRPEIINEDPYGEGWMFKMKLARVSGVRDLMDAAAYDNFIDEESE